jgi:L,D-peptidoglycan transpeptidase YkuD (ErfK/YbiS/YcfS/YnhG family)
MARRYNPARKVARKTTCKTTRKTARKTARKSSLSAIHVRVRPRLRAQAWLVAGQRAIRAALGRASVKPAKREGDGATPVGLFHPVRLWWRSDRLPRPRSLLPVRRIRADDAWCEDPNDRRYNRPFRRSANEPGDRLQRADGLYDLIVEIDHNTRPRIGGRGSAVFIHVARPGFGPTAGCVALSRSDLQHLVSRLSRKTRIIVHS